MKTQKSFKTVGIVIALAALLGIVLFAIGQKDYGNLRMRSEQAVDAMNKEYAEDTYGGATPEETLQLFTDALKKGDTELASKYFLPEDREDAKDYLEKLKVKDNFALLLTDLAVSQINVEEDEASVSVVENGIVTAGMTLGRSPYNGKWKIIEF